MASSEAQRNAAVMAAAYAGYAKGDPQPFLDALAPAVTARIVAPRAHYAFGGPRRGPDEFRRMIEQIAEAYEWRDFRHFGTIAERDRVVAITGGRIRHRASDTTIEIELADVVRLKDGKVVDIAEYFDTAGALARQAGAPPRERPLILAAQFAAATPMASAGGDDTAANAAAVRAAYAAYARRDPRPWFDLLAEEACYCSQARIEDFRFAGPCHGKAAVMANLGRIAEEWSLERCVMDETVAAGPWVVALGEVAFRHRATGRLAAVEKVDVYRFRGGKTAEFCEFFDTASVLMQIGRPAAGAI